MITSIFWGLFALDTVGLIVLAVLASRGPSSPEGPVGGWLILVPPVLMAVLAILVLVFRTDAVKIPGIAILAIPLVATVVGPVYSAIDHYLVERSIAGDDDFRWPAQRNLAHAIKAHDVGLVKRLIPLAGDLNKQYGSETLLRFALTNAPDEARRTEGATREGAAIVKALLDAGANPDQPLSYNDWPLTFAIPDGPEVTQMMLEAGANPDRRDGAGRPLWWDILSQDSDAALRTLQILLDHGANLNLRDTNGGPVGWAAYNAEARYYSSWRLVWLLVERGANWRGEEQFGQTVVQMLANDLERRAAGHIPISEEMRKLHAKFTNP
jgi:hypothetical protein